MTTFQKVAIATCVSLFILILAGAIVRASGAGMGCPDWPTCWGCLIPPTSADDIDPAKLDIEKYRRKAEQYGIDPETITHESVIASFNPVHTWTEYLNRLTSAPLSLLTLATFIMSLWQWRKRKSVTIAAFACVLILLANALLGAHIVYSGLKPGIITAHLILAVIMLCLLVYIAWRGCDQPWKIQLSSAQLGIYKIAVLLFALVLAEGVLGSQIREKTDMLKKTHHAAPRSEWVGELEQSAIYLIHRSASWAVLLVAGWFFIRCLETSTGARRIEQTILAVVIAQMVLGLILSQVGILPVVQVLHIILSSILVSALLLWILAARKGRSV